MYEVGIGDGARSFKPLHRVRSGEVPLQLLNALRDRASMLARVQAVLELGDESIQVACVLHHVDEIASVFVLVSVAKGQGLEHNEADGICVMNGLSGDAFAVQ